MNTLQEAVRAEICNALHRNAVGKKSAVLNELALIPGFSQADWAEIQRAPTMMSNPFLTKEEIEEVSKLLRAKLRYLGENYSRRLGCRPRFDSADYERDLPPPVAYLVVRALREHCGCALAETRSTVGNWRSRDQDSILDPDTRNGLEKDCENTLAILSEIERAADPVKGRAEAGKSLPTIDEVRELCEIMLDEVHAFERNFDDRLPFLKRASAANTPRSLADILKALASQIQAMRNELNATIIDLHRRAGVDPAAINVGSANLPDPAPELIKQVRDEISRVEAKVKQITRSLVQQGPRRHR